MNVAPNLSANNHRDETTVHSELFRQRWPETPSVTLANIFDLRFSKFRLIVSLALGGDDAPLRRAVPHILSVATKEKVSDVPTKSVIAFVANLQFSRDWSPEDFPHRARNFPVFATLADHAVSRMVPSASPYKAGASHGALESVRTLSQSSYEPMLRECNPHYSSATIPPSGHCINKTHSPIVSRLVIGVN